jgi:NADH-quinone oxidoreductase subunit N
VVYGSLISLYQTSFKRLLAYGSMVHIGLIIFSISLFTIQSVSASLFYLFSYILLMLFTFSFMFFLFEKNNDGLFYLDDISQFSLFLSKNILLSILFSLILFSLAGLPFFIGFIAK